MLVKDLRRQVSVLEEDLRTRSEEGSFASALKTEYDEARKAERTASTYGTWRDERVTQVAVAWVLGTVFVRFCEDNGLIEWPFIAGPGDRLADAVERHEAFFKEHPEKNDRDWIVTAFDHLASSHKTVEGLFDKRYNPLWEITPSFEQATALLNFWRRRGDDGEIRYDFTDDDWDTRFLGDLYQDLSEHARKTYALLQTPEFVEEFILDLTLEPAVEEFGLKGLRTIDPTCGSGHFLLGIFHRLLAKWRVAEPNTGNWELIFRSLKSVHGCDKNPFAASIARFRLLTAVLHAAGKPNLTTAPHFPISIAVGDSLLHGKGVTGEQVSIEIKKGKFVFPSPHTYRTEDVEKYINSCNLLEKYSYHAVVGNPPYIEVKDKSEKKHYKDRYKSCHGLWVLAVPFVERLFNLAIRTHGQSLDSGFIGQITGNSFMKRNFGRKLIEEILPNVQLTHVIDTSGAFIPGHGTPTVILVGRNHMGRQRYHIRTVSGVQTEPKEPTDPRNGKVWSAIVSQIKHPDSESEWVTVRDVEGRHLAKHPWSLGGGTSNQLLETISSASVDTVRNKVKRIGFVGMTHADDVMIAPTSSWHRRVGPRGNVRHIGAGDGIRDWTIKTPESSFFPYDDEKNVLLQIDDMTMYSIWPFRTELGNRATTNGNSYFADDIPWYQWHQLPKDLNTHPHSITFSFIATHNHFALDRESRIFKQSAPVLRLPADATEEEHFELLAALNSSTACFWLKQVSHNKGRPGAELGGANEPWEQRYEFASGKIGEFKVPKELPTKLSKKIDNLSITLIKSEPSFALNQSRPDRATLDALRSTNEETRARMIALQEELDWSIYKSYGILSECEGSLLTVEDPDRTPGIGSAERAFAIVAAMRLEDEPDTTTWFTHHNHNFKPSSNIPAHWPQWYKDIIEARIEIIANRQDIALLEGPNFKRRWATVSWEKREAEALRSWLLDRCEKPELWFALRDGMKHPRTLTVSQLADQFRDDADMNSVAQLYATDHLKKRDLTLAQILEQVIADQHVPYLAALRYKDTGLRKREQWEEVWELQREEDRTGKRLDIPVPPKYGSGDFRKTSYWSQRGKLDVPKERFISYPDASPDADPTLLLGWAGWDHKDQAQALVNTVNDRTEQSGWSAERLTPLLAGLLEVLPWVKQWHGEYDDEWGGVPADEYDAYLTEQRAKHQLTEDDLRAWRPAAPTRGRRAAKKD